MAKLVETTKSISVVTTGWGRGRSCLMRFQNYTEAGFTGCNSLNAARWLKWSILCYRCFTTKTQESQNASREDVNKELAQVYRSYEHNYKSLALGWNIRVHTEHSSSSSSHPRLVHSTRHPLWAIQAWTTLLPRNVHGKHPATRVWLPVVIFWLPSAWWFKPHSWLSHQSVPLRRLTSLAHVYFSRFLLVF